MGRFFGALRGAIVNHGLRAVAIATVGAGAAGAAGGYALSAHPTAAPGAPSATISTLHQPTGHGHGHGHGKDAHKAGAHLVSQVITVVAQQTGQSTDAVIADLKGGKTLNQIAGDKAPAVKDAITQMLTQRLDAQVSAGHITKDQETARLNALSKALDKLMAAPGPTVARIAAGGKPATQGTPAPTSATPAV